MTGDAYPEGKFYQYINNPDNPMTTHNWDDFSGLPEVFQGDIYFKIITCTIPIPTLSQWGILTLSIFTMIFGVIAMRQRKTTFA